MNTASASASQAPFISPAPIVEREDGRYQIGLDDDALGPFETIQFAEAVAAERAQARAGR